MISIISRINRINRISVIGGISAMNCRLVMYNPNRQIVTIVDTI